MAAFGPVFIQGRGGLTRVEVDPADVTIGSAFNTFNDPAFVSPGNDLRDTILADVTVTNAALIVRPDSATTPVPAQLKNIVIANTQVTGIAGAAIHYADLQDMTTFAYITPGLLVQLPRHGADSRSPILRQTL